MKARLNNEHIISLLNLISSNWKFITTLYLFIIISISLYPHEGISHNETIHDKFYHFIAYLFLTIPVSLNKPKYFFSLYLFFIVLGGFVEFLQPYFNRKQELADLIANILGIFIGAFTGHLLREKYFKPKN